MLSEPMCHFTIKTTDNQCSSTKSLDPSTRKKATAPFSAVCRWDLFLDMQQCQVREYKTIGISTSEQRLSGPLRQERQMQHAAAVLRLLT